MSRFFALLLLSLLATSVLAAPPHSFPKAKKIVYKIFAENPKTLYCNCSFNETHQINLKSCHMDETIMNKRAHVVEIEHIVPVDTLGHQLTCWQNALCEHHGKHYRGRRCCEKKDAKFRDMESELYNLWPAVGLINISRSNYSYGQVNAGDRFYGCDFKINKSSKEIEPANTAKGIVARATLFMSDKYHMPLDENKRRLYLFWNKTYPPSAWEKSWALKIAHLEGYTNPYISLQ